MKCPQCSAVLVMGERMSMEIDYCPQCRGIWLEKGKLDDLLRSASKGEETRRNRKDEDDDGGGILGSIGSLLGGD